MPLSNSALTTYATVKAELRLSDDSQMDVLERYINVASSEAERFCNRPFGKLEVTEKFPGAIGAIRLVLARRPVISVTYLKRDGTELDPSEYSIEDAAAGFLRRESGFDPVPLRHIGGAGEGWGGAEKLLWEVQYFGGYVLPKDAAAETPQTLPFDLEQAIVEGVVAIYRGRGRDKSVSGVTIGGTSVQYSGRNPSIGREGSILPDSSLAVLKRYQRVV